MAHHRWRHAAKQAHAAATALEDVLENQLQLPIAREKTTVVGISTDAVAFLASRLAIPKTGTGPSVRKLGIDFSCGCTSVPRAAATRNKGLADAKRRLGRTGRFASHDRKRGLWRHSKLVYAGACRLPRG